MIDNFPYITALIVNDCYAYQNFKVETGITQNSNEIYKHIILTGKNGSGKTTILKKVAYYLNQPIDFDNVERQIQNLRDNLEYTEVNSKQEENWQQEIKELQRIIPTLKSDINQLKADWFVFSYFRAHRKVNLESVNTVTKEEELTLQMNSKMSSEEFANKFKQYLVNKKVYEAFDLMENDSESIRRSNSFFDRLLNVFRTVFHDPKLELKFVRENFEFYLVHGDGQEITFNQLSEGYSAFLSILMDLFMRVDFIQKAKKDFSYEPQGFVLIDEPETHMHLSMQYEVLPLLTSLFPKLQFIIATHSPAVISSLKNAVVYDITKQKAVSDWVLGTSYSSLMMKHFGLENEFSPFADEIIRNIQNAVKEKNTSELQKILEENEKYLSPSLRMEIESQIIILKSELE